MDAQSNKGCFGMRIIEYHDVKTLLGPCFISFSLPLLIPGVVLTVVGSYGNEHWFPAFGGWHITGIVILAFAILLLITGIVLKCCFRPIISAEIEQHLSPTPSMITGSKNLGHEDGLLVISSTGSKLNNKVSHRDSSESAHVLVSTHDKREHSNRRKKSPDENLPNGLEKTHHDTPDSSTNDHINKSHSSGKTLEKANFTTTTGGDSVISEAAHETARASRKKRSRKTDEIGAISVVEENEGSGVRTKVTSTVTTETRDSSRDVGVNPLMTEDVNPKRKKKKKRKHSKNSLSKSLPEGDSEDDLRSRTRDGLPALRTVPPNSTNHNDTMCTDSGPSGVPRALKGQIPRRNPGFEPEDELHLSTTNSSLRPQTLTLSQPKSVLLHAGEHPHHDNMHVHFRSTPDVAPSPTEIGETEY